MLKFQSINKLTRLYAIRWLYGLLLLFSSLLCVKVCAASQVSPSPAKKILIMGDSLSSAYNMPVEKGWVSLLESFASKQGLNLKMINASISGETTAGGLSRLKNQLNKHQPDIVIIELGGNDGLRGLDLVVVQQNLLQMIKLSQQTGAKVLLAAMQIPPNYGRTYTERFTQLYANIAAQQKVVLIPFLLEGVATNKQYMQSDGIHPNSQAQPLIMQNVWQCLRPLLD